MLQQGYNKTSIADVVGVNRSTIGREIKRNKDSKSGIYKCQLAQDNQA